MMDVDTRMLLSQFGDPLRDYVIGLRQTIAKAPSVSLDYMEQTFTNLPVDAEFWDHLAAPYVVHAIRAEREFRQSWRGNEAVHLVTSAGD